MYFFILWRVVLVIPGVWTLEPAPAGVCIFGTLVPPSLCTDFFGFCFEMAFEAALRVDFFPPFADGVAFAFLALAPETVTLAGPDELAYKASRAFCPFSSLKMLVMLTVAVVPALNP